MTAARRQHFIPRFYLAGFTASGSDVDFLHVVDQRTGRTWRSRPGEVAHARDFYRIDGEDPGAVEDMLGRIESRSAQLLRQIESTHELPDGEARLEFLFFVALLAARIPGQRSQTSRHIDEISKKLLQINVSTAERWKSTAERMRAAGIHDLADTPYEEMKAIVEANNFTVDMSRGWHIHLALQSTEVIYGCLADREWHLIVADPAVGEFVCSDNPGSEEVV